MRLSECLSEEKRLEIDEAGQKDLSLLASKGIFIFFDHDTGIGQAHERSGSTTSHVTSVSTSFDASFISELSASSSSKIECDPCFPTHERRQLSTDIATAL